MADPERRIYCEKLSGGDDAASSRRLPVLFSPGNSLLAVDVSTKQRRAVAVARCADGRHVGTCELDAPLAALLPGPAGGDDLHRLFVTVERDRRAQLWHWPREDRPAEDTCRPLRPVWQHELLSASFDRYKRRFEATHGGGGEFSMPVHSGAAVAHEYFFVAGDSYRIYRCKLAASPDGGYAWHSEETGAHLTQADWRRRSFDARYVAHIGAFKRRPNSALRLTWLDDVVDGQKIATYICPAGSNDALYYCCVAALTGGSRTAIAVGDTNGRVHLWETLPARTSPSLGLPTQSFHWHFTPVGALAWTPHGATLYSAGAEGVLVRCTLHTHARANRDFVPNLGQAVNDVRLSDDATKIAVKLVDGAIVLLDSRLEEPPVRLYCGGLALPACRPPPLGIRAVPACRWPDKAAAGLGEEDGVVVLTNGNAGFLQVAELDGYGRMRHGAHQIDIAQETFHSHLAATKRRDPDGGDAQSAAGTWTEVVDCDVYGSWLALLLAPSNERHCSEHVLLAFWHYDRRMMEKPCWLEHARVERPHNGAAVAAHCLRVAAPSGDESALCLTAAADAHTTRTTM